MLNKKASFTGGFFIGYTMLCYLFFLSKIIRLSAWGVFG